MYDLYNGASDDEQSKVAYLIQLFQFARNHRVNFEVMWEEGAALTWPEYRNSFAFGHVRAPGVKYTQYQVDSTPSVKAQRFMAIADAMITPFNMMWSKYCSTDPELMKVREARIYYEQVTNTMWSLRYRATANFMTQQQMNWQALGVFGNIGMMVDEMDNRPMTGQPRGLRYIGNPPGEIYILVNHQGRVDGYIRHFRWNGRQAFQRWGHKINAVLRAALEKADVYTLFDFLEFVIPRTDYDPMQIFSNRGKPWSSTYLSIPGYCILEEGGYWDFPLAHGRYSQAPEEWYGRGCVQTVLPELKTKNAQKESFLKQGKLAGDPMYLLPEDGMFDFKAEAGAYNYGGMNEDGKRLVDVLPAGDIAMTEKLMEESDRIIDGAFLQDLFPLLFNKNGTQRSARESQEVANQVGIFLAPTLGRQYGEYMATLCQRELGVAKRLGLLPKVPDVVREAKGGIHTQFTSPLARALKAQGIAGFMRSVEMTTQVANSSQDDSVWDVFDFDTANREIASEQYVPERWMASPKMVAQKRKQRAAAQAEENRIKSLPAEAANKKADAIVAKAQTGGNIGGTLSGTPASGMPGIPGNAPGQPGMAGSFGVPGLPGRPAGM